jgi:A/G-specific adenine glycosylase
VQELSHTLAAWFVDHARPLPWREPDCSPWGVLVSEIMLQQTPVSRVLVPWRQWLDRWPDPPALAAAPVGDALVQWGTLGYPRRAVRLHAAATVIASDHGGAVPDDVGTLLGLPGIGDYTARAVAVFAFEQRHAVVDTNTRRVLARVVHGRSQQGRPSRRDLDEMEELLPADVRLSTVVNAAAMELGAVVCTSRAPRCGECPVAGLCAWRRAGHPDTGDDRVRQAAYEGSDRQARGAVLHSLRGASPEPVQLTDVAPDWPDLSQRDRAIVSLLADGLVRRVDDRLALPR